MKFLKIFWVQLCLWGVFAFIINMVFGIYFFAIHEIETIGKWALFSLGIAIFQVFILYGLLNNKEDQ